MGRVSLGLGILALVTFAGANTDFVDAATRGEARKAQVATQENTPATYPESREGLRNLLDNLVAAEKAHDAQKSAAILDSLEIPNHAE